MKALDVVPKLTAGTFWRASSAALAAIPSSHEQPCSKAGPRSSAPRISTARARDAEAGTARADLFRRLAGEAEAQAAIWRAQLDRQRQTRAAAFRAGCAYATRRAARAVAPDPGRLRAVLAAMKVRGMAIYSTRATGGWTQRTDRRRHRASASRAWAAAATCARRCSASTTGSCRTRA